jgi:hypothetical protein
MLIDSMHFTDQALNLGMWEFGSGFWASHASPCFGGVGVALLGVRVFGVMFLSVALCFFFLSLRLYLMFAMFVTCI